ncbi:MICAL-like protein 2 isoform X2 [Rhineura floridana]|uniref:MICAL-like protein 2 isoform X2 n=1 Tax=Rhineura floridana TaxID=261503 RepID=UPI002AC7EC91|nr:MICAL-like protein 2 isoform X2 [Rhineura floridana]
MAAIQALQQWCKQQCEGYREVSITNMTTSFRDGLAFCAILHRHRPDLIDFNSLSKENVFENNQLAFQVAETELGIPALLDAEDMVALKVPDRLSVLTYVSQYYNYFHGRSPIGGVSGIKRPPSKPSEEPTGKKVLSEPVAPAPAKPSRVHPSPEPKTDSALQGRSLVKENPPATARRVLEESSNTRNSSCAICGSHVHLVQRLLMDGKLYHRNCFRCKQCSSTLQSGKYKTGTDPGTFICNRHEQPTHPQNSLSVSSRGVPGDDKPTGTTPAARNDLKGLASKVPTQETVKTSQALGNSSAVQAAACVPFNPGNKKSSSVSASAGSRWLGLPGNKSDPHEASPSLSHWTASSAKTQQAREKFFQAGSWSSGLSTNKTEPVKNQGTLLNPPWVAGRASCSGALASGTSSGTSEKDKARSVLMHALPGSQPSTHQPGGYSSAWPSSLASSTSKPSSATSGFQPLERKSVSPVRPSRLTSVPTTTEDPRRAPLGRLPVVERSPKDPGCQVGVGTTTQNRVKDQPISRPADFGHKLDVKVSKAGVGSVTEEKSETPADWRSRLKPVADRRATCNWMENISLSSQTRDGCTGIGVSSSSDARTAQKTSDVHKVAIDITLSPAQNEKKPTPSVTSPANPETASLTDQPPKRKLLVPHQDISSGWQKAKQQWEDLPATQRPEGLSPTKKTIAPVKPSPPRAFQKYPTSQVGSPSKLHPDYIPEEEIQKEVRQIEKDLDKLELKGVDMEKQLRNCEGDDTEDVLMVEWFKLIHEKQLLLRRESELMHKMNQQKLEAKQWDIESELRNLMSKSDFSKTPRERAREEELLKLYVATVDDRNKIVEDLDEDRIRELEEDEMLAAMIQKLDVPRNPQESEKKKMKFGLFKLLKTKN